jgi:hypothetical protein
MRYSSHTLLPIPTEPLFGESLPGFVARACARNGYYHIRRATILAGHTGAVGSLGGSAANWASLAHTFGTQEAELIARRHPVCRIEGLTRVFENFFGYCGKQELDASPQRRSASHLITEPRGC